MSANACLSRVSATLKIVFCLLALISVTVGAAGEESPWSHPAVTITGRVLTEPGGAGVKDATVVVQTGRGYGLFPVTDASGVYQFTLEADREARYPNLWIDQTCLPPGVRSPKVDIQVTDQDISAPDLYFKLPQRISGTVRDASTDKPIPGVTIRCSYFFELETDENGRYCYYVNPGTHEIRCQGTPDRYYPDGFRQVSYGIDHSVEVLPGQNVDDCDFVLESGPALEGRITDAEGNPVPNARVWVFLKWPSDYRLSAAIRLSEVQFMARADSEGNYRVHFRVSYPYYEPRAEPGVTMPAQREDKVTFTVMAWREDDSRAGCVREERSVWKPAEAPLNLVLGEAASLRFRLVDHLNQPVEKAHIWIWDASRSLVNFERHLQLGETGDGHYEISALPSGFPFAVEVDLGYSRLFRNVAGIEAGREVDLGTLVVARDESFSVEKTLDLISHRRHDGSERRSHAVRDLGLTRLSEEEVAKAVPVLVAQLDDTSEIDMRIYVVRSLGNMGPPARDAVPALVDRLNDVRGKYRWGIAEALGRIGGPQAAAALEEALRDPNERVREEAREALEKLR